MVFIWLIIFKIDININKYILIINININIDMNFNNINLNVCHTINNNDEDDLINNISNLNVTNQPLTIYISNLLEKLSKELTSNKVTNIETGKTSIEFYLPHWFNSIDVKYQNILLKLIEPVLYSESQKKLI